LIETGSEVAVKALQSDLQNCLIGLQICKCSSTQKRVKQFTLGQTVKKQTTFYDVANIVSGGCKRLACYNRPNSEAEWVVYESSRSSYYSSGTTHKNFCAQKQGVVQLYREDQKLDHFGRATQLSAAFATRNLPVYLSLSLCLNRKSRLNGSRCFALSVVYSQSCARNIEPSVDSKKTDQCYTRCLGNGASCMRVFNWYRKWWS